MLSRAVRADGRKVVLTGEGSDELLAGYPHFRRDMLLHHTQGQSPEEVQRLMNELVANNQVSRGTLMPEGASAVRARAVRASARAVLEFVPSWLETQAIAIKSAQRIMSDEFVAAQGDIDTVGTFLASIDVKRCLEGRNAVHAALYLWAKSALPHYVLSNLGDRMEMGHSVEGRVPFMDHHVAEYLQNVPVNLKIRSMTEKYILREAVKDVITDTVYKRQKHPFLSPPSTHHKDAPLHQLMQDTLRSSAARDVPFLDQGKLIAMLDGIDYTNPGLAAVNDINLTVAMSYVFMHEGLRLRS
jgi:asparagine synthase (glutamine-hydrolysing)